MRRPGSEGHGPIARRIVVAALAALAAWAVAAPALAQPPSAATPVAAASGHHPEEGRPFCSGLPGMPLGLLSDAPPYTETEVVLDAGDQLILYSDGVTEAQDEAGEEFGEERLQAVVRDADGLSADVLADRIVAAIDAFAGAAPQFDDITLMVVRRR